MPSDRSGTSSFESWQESKSDQSSIGLPADARYPGDVLGTTTDHPALEASKRKAMVHEVGRVGKPLNLLGFGTNIATIAIPDTSVNTDVVTVTVTTTKPNIWVSGGVSVHAGSSGVLLFISQIQEDGAGIFAGLGSYRDNSSTPSYDIGSASMAGIAEGQSIGEKTFRLQVRSEDPQNVDANHANLTVCEYG